MGRGCRLDPGRRLGALPPPVYSGCLDFGGGGAYNGRPMIEALKSEEIVKKLGGRFKLTALIQRRLKELVVDGARPLVDRKGRTDLELVIEEIIQEKIAPDFSETGYQPPKVR